MESFKIEDLKFSYPTSEKNVLDGITFSVNQGEFVTVCGRSGCGKTTLLRMLKPRIAPHGKIKGSILFCGKPFSLYDEKMLASEIGFVMQNPDNQIVTDKVWHELAFGLESLGYDNSEIKTRVSEMASFFGFSDLFYRNTSDLSGGQKQILNLASVMVMQPSVLILDEPTSQLDPIASREFLKTLERINREFGTTVILSEHRLEDAFPLSDRVIVMENGRIIADDRPENVGALLKENGSDMYAALPTPMIVHGAVQNDLKCPLTVREGREWLEEYSRDHFVDNKAIPRAEKYISSETAVEMQDVWFRYEKNSHDVIKGLSLKVSKGELFALVGGNGSGKTTTLSLISRINKPYRGKVLVNGKDVSKTTGLYDSLISVLPQDPQSVFLKKTVFLDLFDSLSDKKMSREEKEDRVKNVAHVCRIELLLDSHPYDLSGGEQQRAALAKVLLQDPKILLLDEPTKGMDAHFKQEFSDILKDLTSKGVTVIMVSHDIEFCAEYADRCALLFDGSITSIGTPRKFFAGKSFYTTAANRMARKVLPDAVIASDIILACGGRPIKREKSERSSNSIPKKEKNDTPTAKRKTSVSRIVIGSVFILLFAAACVLQLVGIDVKIEAIGVSIMQIITVIFAALALFVFFPQKQPGVKTVGRKGGKKMTKRTAIALLIALIVIPLTIFAGAFFLDDRKYYFISLMIMLETFIPFLLVFESKKPKARELVMISVLCAIAVTSRAAFFMLPQFKPVLAIVIISGICFGGETGFLVGAVTGFVSNFFFGQGPWTPWQMFAFGIVGLLAGILFKSVGLRKTRAVLCIFGFFVTVIIYGGIMDPSSVIISSSRPTVSMIMAAYASGAAFNLIHGLSTAFFLWFISEEMIDKLERVKTKYGLVE